MNISATDEVGKVVALSSVDHEILQLQWQKKRSEKELQERALLAKNKWQEWQVKFKAYQEKKLSIDKEERQIKEEQDRLVARRKALGTMNNYKVQQAAEREIEGVAKELAAREELLLTEMEDAQALQQASDGFKLEFDSMKVEYDRLVKDVAAEMHALDERLSRKLKEREEVVKVVAGESLALYDRVRSRYPENPVVKIREKNQCSGCGMSVGPQTILQISKGTSLVKCPGCGRLLWQEFSEEE